MVAITEDLRAKEIIKRLDRLKSGRGTYDDHAQDAGQHISPRKGYVTTKHTKGSKTITINSQLFDPTAVFANQYMTAGLISHLSPPNQRWFGLKARQDEINKSESARTSYAKVASILHDELAVSNFYLQLNELINDLGWAGMGCMNVKEGKKTTLGFKTHHVSEYWTAEDNDAMVDTVYYEFKYSARQAAQEWGKDNLGKKVRDALTSDKPEDMDKEFTFIQELRPRGEHDSFPARGDRRPISSIFVGREDKNIIKEDGFYEMPKLTPRWLKNSNEVTGRGQGMFALPWIKQLNQVWKDIGDARQMKLRPPVLTPDDGFIGPLRATPGAIWHYRASYAAMPNAIRQLDVAGDTNDAMEQVKYLTEVVQKAFFNDLFVWLAEQTGQKTAYEIAQRIEEKHTMIVPPIGRLQSELFNGLITRCIGICGRAGKFQGIIAPEIMGQEYEIQYISKLALAVKLLEVRSIVSTYEVVAPIAEQKPMVLDNFNDDKIARGVSERLGVPPDWMNTEDEVDEIREGRAAKEDALLAAELATEAAKAAPGISKKVEEGSVLEAMTK